MKPCRPVPRLLLLIGLWLPWPALASGAAIDTVKLLGTWQALESHPDKGQVETLFTIRDDRTFSGSMSVNSEIVWTWGGDWTLAGNRLTWHYTRSTLTLHESHRSETDEILSVSDDTLTYRSGSRGSVSTLQRLPPERRRHTLPPPDNAR
jgi:hypothetical protein